MLQTKRMMTTMTSRCSPPQTHILIITAAGSSSRMHTTGDAITQKKEFLPLQAGTVLSCCAFAFVKDFFFDIIIVTYKAGKEQQTKDAFFFDPYIKDYTKDSIVFFVCGGQTRQQSVFSALEATSTILDSKRINKENALVLVQDGARPFATKAIISNVLSSLSVYDSVAPAIEVIDTLKQVDPNNNITQHLIRKDIRAIQTPQGFKFFPFFLAHQKAKDYVEKKPNIQFTDDTQIWDMFCPATFRKTHLVAGATQNTKITYPCDLQLLQDHNLGEGKEKTQMQKSQDILYKTGIGYDKHLLVSGRRLLLGGVELASEKGEQGHSDADALLHAITDALLGAAGIADIGELFPPNDMQYKDANSKSLLKKAFSLVQKAGYRLCNLDCVVLLQKPKFLPYREQVRQSIATILDCDKERVFIKAKTGEGVGYVGKGKCVEAFATCLLIKSLV